MSIGLITGLVASSAVLEVSLKGELLNRLSHVDGKDEVSLLCYKVVAHNLTPDAQIIRKAVSDIGYIQNLKGQLRTLVVQSYVNALRNTHGKNCQCFASL